MEEQGSLTLPGLPACLGLLTILRSMTRDGQLHTQTPGGQGQHLHRLRQVLTKRDWDQTSKTLRTLLHVLGL